MKTDYHEFAIRLASELFPELSGFGSAEKEDYKTRKDKFDLKVSLIERHIWLIVAPLEAAANHDLHPNQPLETTIRDLYQLTVDLKGE